MRNHEQRVLLITLFSGAPAIVALLALLIGGDFSAKTTWTLGSLAIIVWLFAAFAARDEAVRPLQTLANLLMSLREGDFSVRGNHRPKTDVAGLAINEVNTLAALLQDQRTRTLEATALLHKVLDEIDLAIFAFDAKGTLVMKNPAAERLRDVDPALLLGGDDVRTINEAFGGGPWELRRRAFRQQGEAHTLVVLTDLRRALREEERQAWQRLVRVLGHEINNSLAPIHSIAGSLQKLLARSPRPDDWETKTKSGLEVVERRAEALNRFLQAYARLTRLPPPRKTSIAVEPWLRRIAALEQRVQVTIAQGPEATINGDPDQLDQVVINLLRNAVDAALETKGGVRMRWHLANGRLHIAIEDDGPGIAEATNLFVPFFTTKPEGSGIGLALSRQITEAHGGTLTLENTTEHSGCVAHLIL